MDISFHYYTVKVLALAAGFAEDKAQVIAENSQFVDDYNWLTNAVFSENLIGLGHTEAGNIPDCPFVKFQMKYSQNPNETSKDTYSGTYGRNNILVFLDAAKQIYKYLSSLLNYNGPDISGWTEDFIYKLWSNLSCPYENDTDIEKIWSANIKTFEWEEVNFHYDKEDMYPQKSLKAYEPKESFFLFNYYAKKIRDAVIVNEVQERTPSKEFCSDLDFYVYPPAEIHISVPGQTTSPDSLMFFIINNNEEDVNMLNTRKLSQVVDVPAINDFTSVPDLSRLFISFDWGNGIRNFGDVTVFKDMQIEVIGDMGTRFYAWKNDVENPYFIIIPKENCRLKDNESIQIQISNIQSHAMLGYADIIIEIVNVDSGSGQMVLNKRLRIDKVATAFEIVSFTADDYTIGKNRTTTLRWKVTGAQQCEINPGQYQVAGIGSKEISIAETTQFTLTAKSNDKEKNQMINVYVGSQSIDFFKAETDEPIDSMSEKKLLWKTTYAENISISTNKGEQIDISQKSIDLDNVIVTPHDDTTYTLMCRGADVPLTKEVTVRVNSVNILYFNGESTLGVGQEINVLWDESQNTGIFLNCSVQHLESGVITDQENNVKYDILEKLKVNPSHPCTHYLLHCEGANGPIEKTVKVNIIDMVHIVSIYSNVVRQGFYNCYYTSWEVLNADSVEVKVLGSVISSDSKGHYETREYDYMDAVLDYGIITVTAQGKGGPVVQTG